MKDFKEVQDFINQISEFEIYKYFKSVFVPLYEQKLSDKTMWVDYSSLIKGISYDLETSTLFVVFVSDKSPINLGLCCVDIVRIADKIQAWIEIPINERNNVVDLVWA